jgi:FKBP-type peptidyl-prolyl cis-trans isomerase
MKKIITSFLLVMLGLSLFAQQPKQAENIAKYRIIKSSTQGRGVNGDSSVMLHMNYKLAIESTDSTLAETFSKNSAVYVPVMEPSFSEVLEQLHVGDSAIITLNADSFFVNSFGQARPPFIKEGENIKFTIKVLDIMNEKELMMKQEEELLVRIAKDSVELAKTISTLNNAKTTASGLTYVLEKNGKGKIAKKGDKTKVLYKGTLLNGQVFDENLTEGISFTVGLGQFIPGWEEMVQLMKFGDKVKVVIPWKLAYGPNGTGPIPPYSSLIFEMELVSAK